jgi:hypothetical protein
MNLPPCAPDNCNCSELSGRQGASRSTGTKKNADTKHKKNGAKKTAKKRRSVVKWPHQDAKLEILDERTPSMTTYEALTNQSQAGSGQEPTNQPNRRTLLGGALVALLSSSGRVKAQAQEKHCLPPNDPFILLLRGLYQSVPAGQGPTGNLGLTTVNLGDGSYSRTRIYPVLVGIPDSKNQHKAIGNFYASLITGLCAYDLPGGAIAMQFVTSDCGVFPQMIVPDGRGGQYDEGTLELTILEATGIYSAFNGGHNHMVDRLHQLVAGTPFAGFPSSGYNEFCFCIISTYQFP